MQETWVRSLVGEDPTCQVATKPMQHNYWSPRALEPAQQLLSPRAATTEAHALHLLKPTLLEPMLHNEKAAYRNEE